jgi:hypothetical protein
MDERMLASVDPKLVPVVAIESSITLEQRYAAFQQAGMFP